MEANKNVIADIKKLEIMNYEDGKTYLEQNGYVQNDSASSTDTTISDMVEDIYFTRFDENDQEVDIISYCTFYNTVDIGDLEIVSQGWKILEKVA
jgi:uncharacterized protein YrrD